METAFIRLPLGMRFSPRTAFGTLLGAYAAYYLTLLWNSSFVLDGQRYFSLMDDAMISMQFAKRLAQGQGLVWSLGERVEGFSNPLWTFYMALPHALGLPLRLTSLFIQLSAGVLMLLNLVLVRRLALAVGASERVAFAAAALTASFGALNNWAVMGMEVSVLTPLSLWVALRIVRGQPAAGTFALCALGLWVRMDAAVLGLVALLALRRHWRLGALILGGSLVLQTGLRYAYYGEWLPNTYYLKMTGYPPFLRQAKGAIMLVKNLYYLGWAWFLLPLALLWREPRVRLLFAMLGSQMAYSVYVGGDAWEDVVAANRFVAQAMPAFFILLALSLERLIQDLNFPSAVDRAALVLALLVAGVNMNADHGLQSLSNMLRPVLCQDNAAAVARGLALKSHCDLKAVVAMRAAGIPPYFSELERFVDIHGKVDKHVARRPIAPVRSFRTFLIMKPGHNKWDFDHSIGALKPTLADVVDSEDLDLASYPDVKRDYVPTGIGNFVVRRDAMGTLYR